MSQDYGFKTLKELSPPPTVNLLGHAVVSRVVDRVLALIEYISTSGIKMYPCPICISPPFYEEGQLESLQRQTETLKGQLKKPSALKSITYDCSSTSFCWDMMTSDDQRHPCSTLLGQPVLPRLLTTGTSACYTYSLRQSSMNYIVH